MNFKSQLSVVTLGAAALALAGAGSASAQDINFTCGPGTPAAATIHLTGVSGNACPGGGLPVPNADDHDPLVSSPLVSYALGGVSITATSGWTYNTFQGDSSPGGPGLANNADPSLNLATEGTAESLTVTDSNGAGLFTFDQVDLRTTVTGDVDYAIQGFDGSTLEYTISNKPTSSICAASVVWSPYNGTKGPCLSSGNYTTVSAASFSDSTTDITKLVITEQNNTGSPGGAFVDWIELTSIPEGGAGFMYLMLAGGVCCGAMFFKRNEKLTA